MTVSSNLKLGFLLIIGFNLLQRLLSLNTSYLYTENDMIKGIMLVSITNWVQTIVPTHYLTFIIDMISQLFVYSSEVTNDQNDNIVEWIEWYASLKGSCYKRLPRLIQNNKKHLYSDVIDVFDTKTQFVFLVDSGPFFIYINSKAWAFGIFNRYPSESIGYNGNRRFERNSIKLYSFSKDIIYKLFEKIRDIYSDKVKKSGIQFKSAHMNSDWGWWEPQFHPPIYMDNLILCDQLTKFTEDIEKFVLSETRAEYSERRDIYKWVSLLTGPPGTGKTHIVKAIAYKLKLKVFEINFASGRCDDEILNILVRNLPVGLKILILDEFDVIKLMIDNSEKSKLKQPSKAGWNNLLDSVSNEGLIIVCITNKTEKELEKLYSDSFLRKQRFNGIYSINCATKEMIEKKITSYYLDKVVASDRLDFYAKNILSMAEVQSILSKNNDELDQALTDLEILYTKKDIPEKPVKMLVDRLSDYLPKDYTKDNIMKIFKSLHLSKVSDLNYLDFCDIDRRKDNKEIDEVEYTRLRKMLSDFKEE